MILARYRLILVPVVILYAAAFLVWMADRLREKRVAWVLGGLGLVLVVAVVQQVWMPLYKPEEYLRPHEYYFSAKIYASEGRFDRAVAKFDRLREIVHQNPRFAEWVATTSLLEGDYRAQWAKQLLEEGKREEARRQVARAEAAYARRVNLNPSVPYYNLGQLYFALDEPTKARVFFKMFLAFEPDGPRADRVRRLLAGLKDSR